MLGMKTPFIFRRFVPVLLSSLTISSAGAAVVLADFNDNTGGTPLSDVNGGQGGGSGWNAADNWGNTGTINVVSGDLSAPVSTNYSIVQSGTANRIQGDFNGNRQTTRLTATTLGNAGSDVWFSFLVNQNSLNSRSGISANMDQAQGAAGRLVVLVGTEVRIGLENLQDSDAANHPSVTIGTTALILGRLSLNTGGDENLDVWVNPDVSGGIAGLGTAGSTRSEESATLGGGLDRLGLVSYSTASNDGGFLDSIRFSDDSNADQAFADVTGVLVPEPSALMLGALGSLLLLRRNRN